MAKTGVLLGATTVAVGIAAYAVYRKRKFVSGDGEIVNAEDEEIEELPCITLNSNTKRKKRMGKKVKIPSEVVFDPARQELLEDFAGFSLIYESLKNGEEQNIELNATGINRLINTTIDLIIFSDRMVSIFRRYDEDEYDMDGIDFNDNDYLEFATISKVAFDFIAEEAPVEATKLLKINDRPSIYKNIAFLYFFLRELVFEKARNNKKYIQTKYQGHIWTKCIELVSTYTEQK